MSRSSRSAGVSGLWVGARGDTVLIIEDNATARDALQSFLKQRGFRTEAASSGEEGLRLARELRPLAIMLDLVIPGMDGWSVLTALKADPELADRPVVLVTGMADEQSEAFRRGASEFVMKPVDPDHLAAVLKRYRGDSAARQVLVADDRPDVCQPPALRENEGDL